MGTGYTRQSAANIATGNLITAADLEAEFDLIEAAFSAATGHTHDGSVGEGPQISLSTSVTGTLPHENGGLEADVSAFDGLVKITGGSTLQVTAPSGAVVGTTDTQTLTNKTIVAANNTITIASTDLSDTTALTYNADTDASALGFVVDEDTMSSDSDTKVPTQQSVKAYVDTEVAGLLIDEDDLSSDSDTKAPTQQSVKAYVDTEISNISFAGITYNTDSDVSGNTWVLDEDDLSSNSDTKVPTQQSVKAYVDNSTFGGGTITTSLTIDNSSPSLTLAGDTASGKIERDDSLTVYRSTALANDEGGHFFTGTSDTDNVGSFQLRYAGADVDITHEGNLEDQVDALDKYAPSPTGADGTTDWDDVGSGASSGWHGTLLRGDNPNGPDGTTRYYYPFNMPWGSGSNGTQWAFPNMASGNDEGGMYVRGYVGAVYDAWKRIGFDDEFVPKTGGTFTGDVEIEGTSPKFTLSDTDNSAWVRLYQNSGVARLYLANSAGTGGGTLRIHGESTTSDVDSVTIRKDGADNEVIHAGNIGDYASSSDWTYGEVTVASSAATVTGLPAEVAEIEIFLEDLTCAANGGTLGVRLGDSGGLETTGYNGAALSISQTTIITSNAISTTYLPMWSGFSGTGNTEQASGIIKIVRTEPGENDWVMTSLVGFYDNSGGVALGGGKKTLSGELDRFNIAGYSDTPTNGQVIRYRYK